jgi:hypothetical protein
LWVRKDCGRKRGSLQAGAMEIRARESRHGSRGGSSREVGAGEGGAREEGARGDGVLEASRAWEKAGGGGVRPLEPLGVGQSRGSSGSREDLGPGGCGREGREGRVEGGRERRPASHGTPARRRWPAGGGGWRLEEAGGWRKLT